MPIKSFCADAEDHGNVQQAMSRLDIDVNNFLGSRMPEDNTDTFIPDPKTGQTKWVIRVVTYKGKAKTSGE